MAVWFSSEHSAANVAVVPHIWIYLFKPSLANIYNEYSYIMYSDSFPRENKDGALIIHLRWSSLILDGNFGFHRENELQYCMEP